MPTFACITHLVKTILWIIAYHGTGPFLTTHLVKTILWIIADHRTGPFLTNIYLYNQCQSSLTSLILEHGQVYLIQLYVRVCHVTCNKYEYTIQIDNIVAFVYYPHLKPCYWLLPMRTNSFVKDWTS